MSVCCLPSFHLQRSVRRILKKLNKRSYRLGRGQYLTEAAKRKRVAMARRMLEFLDERQINIFRILFSDEKIFKIGRILNRQNHRQILTRGTRRGYVHVGRQQYPRKNLYLMTRKSCSSFQSE